MSRWIPGVLVLLGASGCGRIISDCFCQPGHLSIPPGQPTLLAAVPRGCARTDAFLLSIGEGRVIPAIAVVSAASTNPHIKIEFPPPPSGNVGQGEFIQLEVTTEVPLDAPSLMTADIDLVTDTGVPRTFSFQLNVPVLPAEAPPALDFGGVAFGTTASIAYSFARLSGAQRLAITRMEGDGFDYAKLEPFPSFEVRFSPRVPGRLDGAVVSDIFTHCPQYERLPLIGDGVTSVLTAAPETLDFGDVAVGTSATRTIEVTNTALAPLQLEPYLAAADFQAAFSTTPLDPARRNAQGQLVPGRTMIEVTFTPHAVGPQTHELGAFANWLSVSTPLRFHVSGVGL